MAKLPPPAWTNEQRKLSQLKAWPENPRYSTKEDAEALAESHDDFGQTHLLLISPDNELYDGHQRLNSWIAKHGPDFVVDVRVSSRRLTDKERRKMLAYMHVKASGRWNWEKIAAWDVDELSAWGFDKKRKSLWDDDANNLKEMLAAQEAESAAPPEFKEYGEDTADGVSACECPTCGHKHARKD